MKTGRLNQLRSRRGLTLAELVIASGIMMFFMAVVFQSMIVVMQNDKRAGVEAELRSTAFKALERVERGGDGLAGLIKAREASIAVGLGGDSVSFSVDQNNPYTASTADDTSMNIYVDDQDGDPLTTDDNFLMYDPDTSVLGDEVLLASGANVLFAKNDHMISVAVKLTRSVRGQPVQISLTRDFYLRN